LSLLAARIAQAGSMLTHAFELAAGRGLEGDIELRLAPEQMQMLREGLTVGEALDFERAAETINQRDNRRGDPIRYVIGSVRIFKARQ